MATVRKKSPRKKAVKKTAKKKPSSKSKSSIEIPTEAGEVGEEINDFNICIFGRKNIGKSTLANSFPYTLTLMFEKGRYISGIRQLPKRGDSPLDWETLIEIRDELVSNIEEHGVLRVAIDTIDQAYECCMDYCCEQGGYKHPGSAPDSVEAWREVKKTFLDMWMSFYEAGILLTFVSHEKAKPLVTKYKGLQRDGEDSDNVKYNRMEPSCTGQAMDVLQQIASYVFYYGFNEGVRCLTIRSPNDVHWTACERQETYVDPDGTPINTFRAGTSAKDTYEVLQKGFNNELRDVDYIPPRKTKSRSSKKRRTRK